MTTPPRRSLFSPPIVLALAGLGLLLALGVWLAVARPGPPAPGSAAGGEAVVVAAAGRGRPAPAPASVRGHVHDEEGRPVAGATVCALSAGLGEGAAITAGPGAGPPSARCATADASGAYALEGLSAGVALALSASAEGFAPGARRGPGGALRLGAGERRAGVDLVLRAGGGKVTGRVESAVDGGPIAGAVVRASGRGSRSDDDGAPWAVAQADSQGEFTLWAEPGPLRLTAAAAGFAAESAAGFAPGHVFVLRLLPSSTLVGRAIAAESGAPVGGAAVTAVDVDDRVERGSARADDDGAFRIEGLRAGRYRLEATAERRLGHGRQSVALNVGETSAEVRVELGVAHVVRGRVTVGDEPCRGGEVTLYDYRRQGEARGAIGDDGRVTIASVSPGTYVVTIACLGMPARRVLEEGVDVVDGDAPEQAWRLAEGGVVRASVVDARGRPASGVDVTLSVSSEVRTLLHDRIGDGAAAADGSYVFTGVPRGAYSVEVRGAEGAHGSAMVNVEAGGDVRVTVKLAAAGAIEGVVRDRSGRPVPGARLEVEGPRGAADRASDDGAIAVVGAALDDGAFRIEGLAPGDYDVRVAVPNVDEPDGHPPPAVRVRVRAFEVVKASLVAPERDEGAIEGRVVDARGEPVAGAFLEVTRPSRLTLRAADEPSPARPTVTDARGRFRLERLAAGAYRVRAFRPGGGQAFAERVRTGSTDVELKFSGGASVSGTFASPGHAVDRFTAIVRERRTSFERADTFFGTGGAFSFPDLPAGDYEITVRTLEQIHVKTELLLAEGEQKVGVELALPALVAIEGRLVDARAARLAGLAVTVRAPGYATKAYPDAGGYFRFSGVPVGPTQVFVGYDLVSSYGFDASGEAHYPVSLDVAIVTDDSRAAFDLGSLHLVRGSRHHGERDEAPAPFDDEAPAPPDAAARPTPDETPAGDAPSAGAPPATNVRDVGRVPPANDPPAPAAPPVDAAPAPEGPPAGEAPWGGGTP
jgi:protocatechuate 3,4-dioxygenase beta subunit